MWSVSFYLNASFLIHVHPYRNVLIEHLQMFQLFRCQAGCLADSSCIQSQTFQISSNLQLFRSFTFCTAFRTTFRTAFRTAFCTAFFSFRKNIVA